MACYTIEERRTLQKEVHDSLQDQMNNDYHLFIDRYGLMPINSTIDYLVGAGSRLSYLPLTPFSRHFFKKAGRAMLPIIITTLRALRGDDLVEGRVIKLEHLAVSLDRSLAAA